MDSRRLPRAYMMSVSNLTLAGSVALFIDTRAVNERAI